MSLFVAGAVFGEVEVSLFVAGAVFKPEREMLYFSVQNACGGREKEPRLRGGLRTDGFMVGSWSDHSRIMVGSAAHWK